MVFNSDPGRDFSEILGGLHRGGLYIRRQAPRLISAEGVSSDVPPPPYTDIPGRLGTPLHGAEKERVWACGAGAFDSGAGGRGLLVLSPGSDGSCLRFRLYKHLMLRTVRKRHGTRHSFY